MEFDGHFAVQELSFESQLSAGLEFLPRQVKKLNLPTDNAKKARVFMELSSNVWVVVRKKLFNF